MKYIFFTALLIIAFSGFADETLEMTAADFEIQMPAVASKLIPGLAVRGLVHFICPSNINIVLDYRPKHGEPFICDGHMFVIYDNSVQIIEEKPNQAMNPTADATATR